MSIIQQQQEAEGERTEEAEGRGETEATTTEATAAEAETAAAEREARERRGEKMRDRPEPPKYHHYRPLEGDAKVRPLSYSAPGFVFLVPIADASTRTDSRAGEAVPEVHGVPVPLQVRRGGRGAAEEEG